MYSSCVVCERARSCLHVSGCLMCLPLALSQTRLDGLAVAFFALCLVLFFYVSYGSCPSYLQSCAPCCPPSVTVRHLLPSLRWV